MNDFIPLLLVAGLVSFMATPVVRRVAAATGFVSNPAGERTSMQPTPMLGGIAIFVGLFVSIMLALPGQSPVRIGGVIIGMAMVSTIGLIDDRVGTPPWLRILVEIAAALVLIAVGVQVQLVDSDLLNIVITVVWVVGICNAFNFLDNMDGLAAGIAIMASGAFFILAVIEGLTLVATLSAAMIGASIGFLYYNFNPATLYMGDTGSLLIGFLIAVMGIQLEFSGRPNSVTWLIPIVILGVPIFDTTLVVLSRLRRRRPIYLGGVDHTSHRFVTVLQMTHARAVMTLYLVAFALALMGLMLRDATPFQARIILIILSSVFVAGLIWLETRFHQALQSVGEGNMAKIVETPKDTPT